MRSGFVSLLSWRNLIAFTFSIISSRKAFLAFSRFPFKFHRLISTLVLLLLSWATLELEKATELRWYQKKKEATKKEKNLFLDTRRASSLVRILRLPIHPPPLTNKFRMPIDAKVINCHNIRESPTPCVAPQPCENLSSSDSSYYLFRVSREPQNQQTLARSDFLTFRCRLNRQVYKRNHSRNLVIQWLFWNLFILARLGIHFFPTYMKNRDSRALPLCRKHRSPLIRRRGSWKLLEN